MVQIKEITCDKPYPPPAPPSVPSPAILLYGKVGNCRERAGGNVTRRYLQEAFLQPPPLCVRASVATE
ncbi:hypothetical protein EVAR_85448_1 [Eumeta japonica]|uniref:Uncharacterized protein n=1 Tax=Eumeta variegata TaxID=151549 RepID=A0A4C1WM81_EUMVA|nr:hypothetical protein EVAR_85448_1 [Eumeta japonica]